MRDLVGTSVRSLNAAATARDGAMAPAKRRAGGAKPAGKAPPHSLVTFAVNQGVDIEHARAQLNAFAEKYGAMMDTTAREALKHHRRRTWPGVRRALRRHLVSS